MCQKEGQPGKAASPLVRLPGAKGNNFFRPPPFLPRRLRFHGCSPFHFPVSSPIGPVLPETLQRHFGLSAFRPGQEEVIGTLLQGRPALAVFPTGGGKSLCYQLPALLLDGLTLVVSPLIALMKDQVDGLQARGIAAARLDSTLGAEETRALYTQLHRGELKLLYIAPERLANERFRHHLRDVTVSLLAIDEAHCISEWGHNFRPDYLKLARFARELALPRVLALTATATPEVARDIRAGFGIAEEDQVQLSFYRPNLRLSVTPCTEDEKRGLLLERLRPDPGAPTIIYTTRQEHAESLAAFLKREGFAARPYHAGLRSETREACQEAFMSGAAPIITATIAFGMGIDKAGIRRIIHYHLPKSLENYTQETGRAGRDGAPSTCELFACRDDLRVLENFIYGDTPSTRAVHRILEQILQRGEEFDLSLHELSGSCDTRPIVLQTILTYLELEGLIAATTPFYTRYRFKFLHPLPQVLHAHPPKRREFLQALFATAKEGRDWLTIDAVEAAAALGCEREAVAQALSDLEALHDLTLQASGVRQGYRLLRPPEDFRALAERMVGLLHQREERDLARLGQVVAYAETPGCLYQHLLSHFGETRPEPCGHCSRCRAPQTEATSLPGTPATALTLAQSDTIQGLLEERHPSLRTPRQLARFLCGLTSPATTRAWFTPPEARRKARLTSHEAFGLLQDHPFGEVLLHCQTLLIP